MKLTRALALALSLAAAAATAYLYSGRYPIGADVPHKLLTYRALELVRERSVARAAQGIMVPPLDEPNQLLAGGADYNEMCAVCHLKPGRYESDFTLGLYPAPPDLTQVRPGDPEAAARRAFWIIKHGIKASGMPAWGKTHADQRIWNMVAFLRRLPDLTPEMYQILTARSDEDVVHDSAE